MRINIRVDDTQKDPELRGYIERRLRFSLARFAGAVTTALFRVEDMNGPRGGIDQRCTVNVTGPRIGELFLDDRDSSPRRAVDRLSDRLDRAVARAIGRARL